MHGVRLVSACTALSNSTSQYYTLYRWLIIMCKAETVTQRQVERQMQATYSKKRHSLSTMRYKIKSRVYSVSVTG